MINAVIYARVSTKKQNVQIQKNQVKKWAEKNGYNIIQVIGDKISGSIPIQDRLGGKRLVRLLLEHPEYTLIVFNIDRLTRNYYNSIWIEKFLINNKIKLISLSDIVDFDDPASLLNWRIKNCINAYFLSDLRKKQLAGIAQAKLEGKYKGRKKGTKKK